MKWICGKCGDVMESKTVLLKNIWSHRYVVDCACTEGMATDAEAISFQNKYWKRKRKNFENN